MSVQAYHPSAASWQPPGGIVAVDLGNTAAKVLISDALAGIRPFGSDHVSPLSRSFAIDAGPWTDEAIDWVRQHAPAVHQWRLASVNRGAASRLQSDILKRFPGADVLRVVHDRVPVTSDLAAPQRIGIDRLLCAFAAGLADPGPPQRATTLVDAGSAVTVDFLDDQGIFRGGAILPGLNLQARSLATGTDLLPQIDWISETSLQSPGKDTVAAIRLGILSGVAGAIDRLATRYGTDRVLITGGDATAIAPHLSVRHRVCHDMVGVGILACRCWSPSESASGPTDPPPDPADATPSQRHC
ncbi:type III pantothenate kinase [Crateriforma conspicua]|uniref:Type III pantothenate kinase n=1 Tax=Crateriforma conspicua TaxID=2527996 RepID=A0A5C6FY58_9PLAN|nr:type III pantothenate kinase [Crateriforma conspicua]TWU66250.1 Type III pantothenate kinase [Crateriforma conspicua]